jgi:hypothetical protein
MTNGNDLAEQGIAAYRAGDRVQARQLLAQAVKSDRNNEQAWYFLAQLQADSEKKRQCLEMVLRINPANGQARAQLDELTGSSAAAGDPFADDPFADVRAAARAPRQQTVYKAPGLLGDIPGADEGLSAGMAQDLGKEMIGALTMKAVDTTKASWWRIWTIAFSGGLIISLIYMLSDLLLVARINRESQGFGSASVDILNLLTTPIFVIVSIFAGILAASYLSYWWLTRRGGTGTLLAHSYAIAVHWLIPSLILSIPALLFALTDDVYVITLEDILKGYAPSDIPSGVLLFTLLALVVSVFTIYLIATAFSRIHGVSGAPTFIAAALAVIIIAFVMQDFTYADALTGFLLGLF